MEAADEGAYVGGVSRPLSEHLQNLFGDRYGRESPWAKFVIGASEHEVFGRQVGGENPKRFTHDSITAASATSFIPTHVMKTPPGTSERFARRKNSIVYIFEAASKDGSETELSTTS